MKTLMNKLNTKKSGKKGFTLMEMLIVVAIIGVLVAIAIPTFNGALNSAKKATDDANIRAAYAQHQVHDMDSTMADDATASKDSTEIDFGDSTYTLQSGYTGVDTSKDPWVGIPKA